MPGYEIVDYYYDNIIEGDDLKNEEAIKARILANDDKGTAEGWINSSSNWYEDSGPKYSKSFKDHVDTENDTYASEIREQLSGATTEQEVTDVTIDEDYEIGNTLTTEKQTKLEEVKEEGDLAVRAEEAIGKLENATTLNTLNPLFELIDEGMADFPSVGELRRAGLDRLASDLSSEMAEAALRKYNLEHPEETTTEEES